MKDKISVFIKRPGQDPYKYLIPNTLDALQELVGGYIECVTIASNACIICNEEGKLRGLPYNCTIAGEHFVGTIVFVGASEDGDFADFPLGPAGFRSTFRGLWEV